MVKFSYMIFYIKDLEKTLAFYKAAFDLETGFKAESNLYAELKTEGVKLAFVLEKFERKVIPEFYSHDLNKPPAACEIVFTVADVSAALEKAKNAGATEIVAPKQMPWGQTICYVRDPEGITIEIASEMENYG